MLIINVLCLMALCFGAGYFIGKGKVEITRPIKMDAETKERIEKQLAEQERAIEQYNAAIRSLTDYQ